MMGFDLSPAREHGKASGTIRTIHCANRAFPCLLGKRREELVHLPSCTSHEVDELASSPHRTSLDLVAAAFCTVSVLIDETAFASRRKPAQHAVRVAR
jgi:hypothetical protein